MTTASLLGASICFGVALLVSFLGYRIRVGDVHLIAGYDPDRTRDPAGLGNSIGGWVMLIGAATLALGVVQLAIPSIIPITAVAFGICVLAAVIAMSIGMQRFLR